MSLSLVEKLESGLEYIRMLETVTESLLEASIRDHSELTVHLMALDQSPLAGLLDYITGLGLTYTVSEEGNLVVLVVHLKPGGTNLC